MFAIANIIVSQQIALDCIDKITFALTNEKAAFVCLSKQCTLN